jgi:hypothetical protein
MDNRERPWRKLRVVVEVTVPPHSSAKESDLRNMVRAALPLTFKPPKRRVNEHHDAAVRVKMFSGFWPAFLRMEKGLKPFGRKSDPNNGL